MGTADWWTVQQVSLKINLAQQKKGVRVTSVKDNLASNWREIIKEIIGYLLRKGEGDLVAYALSILPTTCDVAYIAHKPAAYEHCSVLLIEDHAIK